ncbi:Hint domain-containing protein [Thioclava electrotropha]|uniref:Hint domain-containing protein n=1 Tax=Thioclava electrotropha TaxID=1549850 RepID=UPI0023A84B2F|nr:Hint domain-containing protein [Thioclava electrotropha]
MRGFSVGYEKGQCPSAAFKLGQSATQCDDGNPKSLSAMTEQQKNRAVSVLYKNTAKFAVTFAISASNKGRNLLFGLGDTLSGGGGDTLVGGADADRFIDLVPGDTIDGSETGDDFDIIDLSDWGWDNVAVHRDAANPENGTIDFYDGNGAVVGTVNFSNIEKVIPCFTPGTLIATHSGARAVESLQVGDRILTRDSGFQVIRWIGTRALSAAELLAKPEFRSIKIAPGALGANQPEREMRVSPQHRILLTGPRAQLIAGEPEVLAAARHLVGLPGIEIDEEAEAVTYIHVMFDNHEIVFSDGLWTESFQPGQATMNDMDQAQRAELLALFPELDGEVESYLAARPSLKRHEARIIAAA